MSKIVIFISVVVFYASLIQARSSEYDAAAETRNFENDVKEGGSYSFKYDTSNGIAAQESGIGGYYAVGSSAYYAPDGQLIQLTYQADENGFQPKGDHLPTPPPIPQAILKALEYIRTHPSQELRQGSNALQQQQQQQQQQPRIQYKQPLLLQQQQQPQRFRQAKL